MYNDIQQDYYQMGNVAGYIGGMTPVKKGEQRKIAYSGRLNTVRFRFIYAHATNIEKD